MITLNQYLTATNADLFSGTEFDPMPYDGVVYIYACSDNDTATMQCPQAGAKSGVTSIIPISDSNAQLFKSQLWCWKIPVVRNIKPVVAVGGTVSKVWLNSILVPKANYGKKETLAYVYKSGTSGDVLSGTLFDTPEYDGVLQIQGAADVATSTLEVVFPGHKTGRTSLLPYTNTDAALKLAESTPLEIPVKAGIRPIVILGGAVTEAYFACRLIGV